MKKLLIILLFWLFFTSCENAEQNINKNIETSKVNQGLLVLDFKQKIEEDYILIDVRTQQEIDNWIIPWTDLFLDYYSDNFASELNKLDKNWKYIIYCAHWNRSKDTLFWMWKMNFNEVFDLKWWIVEWINEWEKIVKR